MSFSPTTAVNPVPRLVLAMPTGVVIAEADNIANTSVPMATVAVEALARLSQEDKYYWLTRAGNLEVFPSNENSKVTISVL